VEDGIAIAKERDVEFLLLPDDELALASKLQREFPGVVFLDETQWTDPETPPVRASILDCGRIATIWNRDIYPVIRGRRRSNGRVDGPEYETVQWLRSLLREPNVLEAGRWAYSLPVSARPEMFAFVDRIWRILLSETTNRMRRASATNPHTPERRIRVGAQAFRHSAEGTVELAADALRLAPEVGFVWPPARPE
jgi:hypothetical protein